jgi:peptidoglycan/xylan/chitin deacetylase (PgdA/CDA1 family)
VNIKSKIKTLCGKMAGVTGVYRRAFGAKMTIVTFHRVTDQFAEDGLTCHPEKFSRFCEFFRRNFTVLPLAEQIAGCRAGRSMAGTLSITFDDGYLNNFQVAAPILKHYELAATFFVTTGFIGSKLVPHWDQQLPVQPGWMTWEQVSGLASMGFEIGNHTDTHLDMGRADLAQIRSELQISAEKLFRALNKPARLFAYPFGGLENITESARGALRDAGFDCCVSSYGGLNSPVTDPYYLRRVSIAGWFKTPDQFGYEYSAGKL